MPNDYLFRVDPKHLRVETEAGPNIFNNVDRDIVSSAW